MKRLWHVVWPWRSPAPPPARCPTSLVPSPSSSTTSVSSPAVSSPVNSPQTTVMITRGRCNVDFCSCLQGRFSSAGGSIEDTPCTRCPHEFSQHGTNREIYPMPQEPIINNNWSMRTAVTSELLRRLLHYQILYVRGTPASGKSVLLNLLHQQLCVQCPSLKVISIVSWPKAMNVLQSRNYLEQLLGCSLSKVTMIPPTVLLVDEAQTTKDDEYFWNTFLKFIVQPDDTPLLVCLFAAYGSAGSNPVEIPSITPPVLSRVQRVELQWYGTDVDQAVGLYLSREEADEIFDKTTSYHQDRPIYGVDFRDYVYAVTSGHAGALTSIIREVTKHRDIRSHYILKGLAITSTSCEQYLFRDISGNRFYDMLRESPFGRGLPPRSCFTDDRYASALNQLLRAPFGYVPSVPRNNALDICYSMGWVHEAVLDTDLLGEEIRGYIFPSPLHRWIVARHLIPRTHSTDPPKKTPLQLTLEILRRFVPSSLSDASLSPRSGRPETRTPPEALYGQEFFRAAHKVLEGHCYPSPEFGSSDPEAGKGWIDLYIPAYKFGIEYLRDGSNIQGHASRFLDGGPYKKWIDAGDMVDYIMLDFRLTQPRDQHPMHPKLFHVIFESNFRRVMVKNSVLQIVDTFNLPEV